MPKRVEPACLNCSFDLVEVRQENVVEGAILKKLLKNNLAAFAVMHGADNEVVIVLQKKTLDLDGDTSIEIDFRTREHDQMIAKLISRALDRVEVCFCLVISGPRISRFMIDMVGYREFSDPGSRRRATHLGDRDFAVDREFTMHVVIEQ